MSALRTPRSADMLDFSQKLDALTEGSPHVRDYYMANSDRYARDRESADIMFLMSCIEPMILVKDNDGLLEWFRTNLVKSTAIFHNNFYFLGRSDSSGNVTILSTEDKQDDLKALAARYSFRVLCTTIPGLHSYVLLYRDDVLITIHPLEASMSSTVCCFFKSHLIFAPNGIYLVTVDVKSLSVWNLGTLNQSMHAVVRCFDNSESYNGVIIDENSSTLIIYNRTYTVNPKSRDFDYIETTEMIMYHQNAISHIDGIPKCVDQHTIDVMCIQ
jgi:hypothetical protein